jgi:hypothetical protein
MPQLTAGQAVATDPEALDDLGGSGHGGDLRGDAASHRLLGAFRFDDCHHGVSDRGRGDRVAVKDAGDAHSLTVTTRSRSSWARSARSVSNLSG